MPGLGQRSGVAGGCAGDDRHGGAAAAPGSPRRRLLILLSLRCFRAGAGATYPSLGVADAVEAKRQLAADLCGPEALSQRAGAAAAAAADHRIRSIFAIPSLSGWPGARSGRRPRRPRLQVIWPRTENGAIPPRRRRGGTVRWRGRRAGQPVRAPPASNTSTPPAIPLSASCKWENLFAGRGLTAWIEQNATQLRTSRALSARVAALSAPSWCG